MNKKLLLVFAVAGLMAAGCSKSVSPTSQSPVNKQGEQPKSSDIANSQAMDKDKMMKDDSMSNGKMGEDKMAKDSTMANEKMEKESMMKQEHGAYVDYSANAVAEATKNGGKAVLFFHANWCPECRAADAAFKADLSTIPSGVTVIKTDYDSNKDLKAKYGVTIQHTFVQVDSQGQLITKWVSGDVKMLIKQLK